MDTMSEHEKLQNARKALREQHAEEVEAKIDKAERALEAAIIALGHEVTRKTFRSYDPMEGRENISEGGPEYVDHVYFGSGWGFYEQGVVKWDKLGNGKLAFRYNEPVSWEKKIIRERKRVVGGFDFVALAKMLIELAAPAKAAALEAEAKRAEETAKYNAAIERRKAAHALTEQIRPTLKDDRIVRLTFSPNNYGNSERIEVSFEVENLETAKAIARDYFSKF